MKPIFENDDNVEKLIVELESWLGTPWAHTATQDGAHSAVKGVGGDCITIITTSLTNIGVIEQLHFPAHIAKPGLAGENEVEHSIVRYLKQFIDSGRMRPINPIRELLFTGDFLTFKLGGSRAHHLGIYRGGRNRSFYHCPGPGRRFMLSALNEAHYGCALQSAYRLLAIPKPSTLNSQPSTSPP